MTTPTPEQIEAALKYVLQMFDGNPNLSADIQIDGLDAQEDFEAFDTLRQALTAKDARIKELQDAVNIAAEEIQDDSRRVDAGDGYIACHLSSTTRYRLVTLAAKE